MNRLSIFRFFAAILAVGISCLTASTAKPAKLPTIKDGSYYGTNYTVPFAHAYRALGALGVDRKEAIDRDVYHMSRLGLNAYRLHLWDVELTDAQGNLLEKDNDHLELLDYLIAQLEKRGIAIVLTAQTNFGNGYPEKNTDPNGAYSYDYPKCEVHDNPAAQQAQENYLGALVRHVNPFTGKSYAADPSILAIEINNEPCHSGSNAEITAYINRMARALRNAGWKKEILYNVSHNMHATQAFYDADIDGTTYQWYPTGLVHGSTRKGNFLPVLDSYDIPFDTIRGYGKLSRAIYEYDPADVIDTYLYPAATRAFRNAGFTWVTQFAYDPIDMARHNTEYQTHFLNLAYTPGKAIGMMIAAEVMRQIPEGKAEGKYPADTVFGNFTVSARRNLASLNDGVRYYHTNSTSDRPVDMRKLRAIAGVGNSPLVITDGTGAYFLDLLDKEKGIWRLEIMPDVLLTDEPFATPSLGRNVAETTTRPIEINPAGLLGNDIHVRGLDGTITVTSTGTISLQPGVYFLSPTADGLKKIPASDSFYGLRGNLRIGEYAAPSQKPFKGVLTHHPALRSASGDSLTVEAVWVSDTEPDSIVLYPASASMWNEHNSLYKLQKSGKYTYSVTLDPQAETGKKDGDFRYRLVVFDRDGISRTYPGGYPGTPLDWDFYSKAPYNAIYSTAVTGSGAPIELLRAAPDMDGSELSSIPEAWHGVSYRYDAPLGGTPALTMRRDAGAATDLLVAFKHIAPLMHTQTASDINSRPTLRLHLGKAEGLDSVKVGLVNGDGFTYCATVAVKENGTVDIPVGSLSLDDTLLNPAPYPVFLKRRFTPDPEKATPLRLSDAETLTVVAEKGAGTPITLEIRGVEIP